LFSIKLLKYIRINRYQLPITAEYTESEVIDTIMMLKHYKFWYLGLTRLKLQKKEKLRAAHFSVCYENEKTLRRI
jgi:hypothetical protein